MTAPLPLNKLLDPKRRVQTETPPPAMMPNPQTGIQLADAGTGYTPRVGTQQPTMPAAQPPAGTAYGQSSAYAPQGNAYGGSTTQTGINPAADLRSQQIAPASGMGGYAAQSDQLGLNAAGALGSGQVAASNYGKLQGLIDQIQSASAGAGASGSSTAFNSPELLALKKQYTDSLSGLQGPDRNALANEAFGLLRSSSTPAYEQELRGVGQKAAALGRVGAGMTTNDLGTVQQRREEALANAQKGLSLDAAGQSLNDKLAASQGIGQGYEMLSRQGLNSDIASSNSRLSGLGGLQAALGAQFDLENLKRGEGESDRSYGLQRSGAYSGLSDQAFGQGQGLRNELRGERGYQSGQAQQGIDNALTQRMSEEDLLNSGFDRGMRTTDLYNRLGNQGVDQYSDALGGSAAGYEQQSQDAFGGIGEMLSEYLASQGAAKNKKYSDPAYTGYGQ